MKVYKSKFGYEIISFIVGLAIIITGFQIVDGTPIKGILIGNLGFLFSLLFFLSMMYKIKYTIVEDTLKVECGFFYKKEFDINTMKSIAKSRDITSAPAPSLDRIEIRYNKFDTLLLSPKDKIGFAKELVSINPSIENKIV
mgnify:CR=1 FL=1